MIRLTEIVSKLRLSTCRRKPEVVRRSGSSLFLNRIAGFRMTLFSSLISLRSHNQYFRIASLWTEITNIQTVNMIASCNHSC